MLCSKRFHLSGSPSTCVMDTVMIPLPSFLFVLGLGVLFILKLHQSKNALVMPPRWLLYIYLFVVFAAFGMSLIELVRLGLEHLGLGLLPMTPIGMILVFVILIVQRQGRTKAVSLLFLLYFLLLSIFEVVKTVRLVRLDHVHPAKGTKYPSVDWWLDNAVMLGLFVVAAIIECITLILRRRDTSRGSVQFAEIDQIESGKLLR